MTRPGRAALGVCIGLCVLAATAHADRADQLFKKGKRLLAEKRFAEACEAFTESDRLDPGIGAKLNVAKCYQDWGKLATAWQWYIDAEQMAQTAKDDRAKKIHKLIEELDVNVPRLTVKAPPDADVSALELKLDHAPLAVAALGVERRVDPGPHEIEYVVDGAKRSKTVPVERGGSSEITLDLPTRTTARTAPRPPAPGAAAAADPGHNRRLLGLGVSGAGVVAIGIAGLVTLGARGDYHDALTDHCRGATDMCDAAGLTATHDARHRANVATAVTLVGLAAVGGGLALYFLAPKPARDEHALYVAPSLGGDGGGVVLGGAF